MNLRIKAFIISLAFLISMLASISPITGFALEENVALNYDDLSNSNQALELSSEPELIPLDEWYKSEQEYWEEQRKMDQLERIFGSQNQSNSQQSDSNPNKKISGLTYSSDPIMNIDVDKLFYSEGDTVQFSVQVTQDLAPVASYSFYVDIYQQDDFDYIHGGWWSPRSETNPVFTFSATTDGDGFYQNSFPVTTSGRYSIHAHSEEKYYYGYYYSYYYYPVSSYRSISVSDLAMFVRMPYYYIPSQPIEGYAIIMDGDTFLPLENAIVTANFYSWDWETESDIWISDWEGTTDSNGRVQFSIPVEFNTYWSGHVVFDATKDDRQSSVRRSIWSSYYYRETEGIEFVPTLDKPIYQPGETIHARALVWKNEYLNATKRPVTYEPVEIQLLRSDNLVILQVTRYTDQWGVVSLDIPLEESLATGTYYLAFKKDNFEQRVEVPLDYYEKPAYRVEISFEKDYVPPGDSIVGEVKATYYFGKPVTNAQVEIKVKELNQIVLSGTTDSQGIYSFTYNVQEPADEYQEQITLEAIVTDPVDRQVSQEKSVILVDDLYLWGWSYPWTPTINDTVNIRFYAYQGSAYSYWYWSFLPLENSPVELTIYGIKELQNGGTTRTELDTISSTTNEYGSGFTELNLDREIILAYHYFEVDILVEPEDGRKGNTTVRFEYAALTVELSVDKDTYQPGDTVSLTVQVVDLAGNPSKGNVYLSISDADYDRVYYGDFDVYDKVVYDLPLSPLAPAGSFIVYANLRYEVTDRYGYQYYRYIHGDFIKFEVGAIAQLNLTSDKPEYTIGETITITGEVSGTLATPIFFEISKRGVVHFESKIPVSNAFEVVITDTEYLAPRIVVFIFAILPNGVILEKWLTIEIVQDLFLDITTDKDNYEPGETASVTIKLKNANGEATEGISVISFVDSSIYGVREDPEWELDHFEDQNFWPIMTTVTNWRGYQPIWYYYWYVMEDSLYSRGGGWGYGSPTPGGIDFMTFDTAEEGGRSQTGAKNAVDTENIEIRDQLPESTEWQPRAWIPESGYSFNVSLPDNIGEWTVRVSAIKGQFGVLNKTTFTTQLPFFVEMTKPPVATQDDIITIKGIFYNYLEEPVDAAVKIEIDDATILNIDTQSIRIPQDYLSQVTWTVYLESPGRHNVTIFAQTDINGDQFSDAIRKQLIVMPNGVPITQVSSGIISSSNTDINLIQYDESISSNNKLVISPGLGAVALDSWERLVGYPYGCLEQTMSRVLPDALILDYLDKQGTLDNNTRNQLENMLYSGLARIYGMQHSNGGFGWWHDDTSGAYMTAYALYGLNIVQSVGIPVDNTTIDEAIKYLLNVQYYDGSWTTSSWRLDDLAFTAYILRSLLSVQTSSTGLTSGLINANSYFKNQWYVADQSPYAAALYLTATIGSLYWDQAFADELVSYLESTQQSDSDGIYWDYDDQYRWRSLGGAVETTATVMQALSSINYGLYNNLLRSNLHWVLAKQSGWGWGSTADTAAALVAIIHLLNYQSSSDQGIVSISVNEQLISSIDFSSTTEISPIDLTPYLISGNNIIGLSSTVDNSYVYYLSSEQILRSEPRIIVPEELSVSKGESFNVPITLIPTSNNVFAVDFNIKLYGTTWDNTSSMEHTIDLLDKPAFVSFSLQAPTTNQIAYIDGIEIDYFLVDANFEEISRGRIHQTIGPIKVSSSEVLLQQSALTQNKITSERVQTTPSFKLSQDTSTGLSIQKTYSTKSSLEIGEITEVTLTISNKGTESEFFLMIEDPLPTGFEVDTTSLDSTSGFESYTSKPSLTSFFLTKLSAGTTVEWTYRLTALNRILSSVAPPATLGSMYDTEVASSNLYVLGSEPVEFSTAGEILRDLSFPKLKLFTHRQINGQQKVHLEVTAEDDDKVSQVIVYYDSGKGWNGVDLETKEVNTFEGETGEVYQNRFMAYIEIHDSKGNVFTSEEFLLSIVSVVIPVITITFLVLVAFSAGTIGAFITQKRLRRDE
ncbi:MAG: MG2 domain-containing protein [Candidatus Hodarchaeales archaeon]